MCDENYGISYTFSMWEQTTVIFIGFWSPLKITINNEDTIFWFDANTYMIDITQTQLILYFILILVVAYWPQLSVSHSFTRKFAELHLKKTIQPHTTLCFVFLFFIYISYHVYCCVVSFASRKKLIIAHLNIHIIYL